MERCPICGAEIIELDGRLVCLNGHVIEEERLVHHPPLGDVDEKLAREHTTPLLDFHRDAGLTVTGDRKIDNMTLAASIKGIDSARIEARRLAYRALATLYGEDKRRVDMLMETVSKVIDKIYSHGRRHKPSRVAFAAILYALNHHSLLVDRETVMKLEAMFMTRWRSAHQLLIAYGLPLKRSYREIVMQYISLYASKLGLQGEVEALAYRIATAFIQFSNRRPLARTLAAAALFLAAKILSPVSYTKVTRVTGLTENGIRKVVREIMKYVVIEVRL